MPITSAKGYNTVVNKSDRVLFQAVYDDLIYLRDRWPAGDLGDAELRRSSTVLRRLATQNELMTVWKEIKGLGPDFMVDGAKLEILDPARLKEVDLAHCSKVRAANGVTQFGASVTNKISFTPVFKTVREPMPLKRYLDCKAMIVKGVPMDRNEVIQFVANERGGAHCGKGKDKPSVVALRDLEADILKREVLYQQILSYGQTLAESASTEELIEGLKLRLGLDQSAASDGE